MAVTRFREFDAEDMVLITGYWLTGPMNLDRSVLQDWLTDWLLTTYIHDIVKQLWDKSYLGDFQTL